MNKHPNSRYAEPLVRVPLDLDSQVGAGLLTTAVYQDTFEERLKVVRVKCAREELFLNLVVALALWTVGGLVVWWML